MASWGPYSSIAKIEEDFVNYYCPVIKRIYENQLGITNWYLSCKNAITIICQLKPGVKDDEKKLYYRFVKFLQPHIRFGYVYSFSIINTCTTYQHFLHFFDEKKDLQRTIKSKRHIRICCLGGGAGVEAVAIGKIINDFLDPAYTETDSDSYTWNIYVYVTIVDICSDWRTDALAIVAGAVEAGIVDSKILTITTNFIHADLLGRFGRNLEYEIKEADIVTMIRLGNDIIERNPEKLTALCKSLRRIVKLLKEDACLFIQESGEGPAFRHLKDALCDITSTNIESYEDIVYCFKETHYEMFKNLSPSGYILKYNFPVNISNTSSCIWIQTKPLRRTRSQLNKN